MRLWKGFHRPAHPPALHEHRRIVVVNSRADDSGRFGLCCFQCSALWWSSTRNVNEATVIELKRQIGRLYRPKQLPMELPEAEPVGEDGIGLDYVMLEAA